MHLSTYLDLLFARLMWIYVLFKRGVFYHSPQIRNTSKHGCTNSGHLVVLSTKCCSVAPNILQHKYCTLLLMYKMCIISSARSRKGQITVRLVGYSRISVLSVEFASCHLSGG